MQRREDAIVLSPSDLMRFQGCAHATTLDLRRLNGEALVPAEDSASAQLIQAKGDAHELAFLDTLKSSGDSGAPDRQGQRSPSRRQSRRRARHSRRGRLGFIRPRSPAAIGVGMRISWSACRDRPSSATFPMK